MGLTTWRQLESQFVPGEEGMLYSPGSYDSNKLVGNQADSFSLTPSSESGLSTVVELKR